MSRPEGSPRAYLAGAMERAPDRGRGWREALRPVLEELGHGWYDPCVEELTLLSDEERAKFRTWKSSGDPRFLDVMRRVVRHDLRELERSDYVVCYWDEHAQWSGGSPSECTLAYVWKKPVYLVCAMPVVDLSSWVQGCATHSFDDLDELASFLRRKYAPA